MKILQAFALFILAFGFCSNAKAQVCGPSITKIYVRDNNGNDIKDVKIEFVNLDKKLPEFAGNWLLYSESAYVIFFYSYKPYGNQTIKISAAGFKTSFQKIMISEAQSQIFKLILKRKGTTESESFKNLQPFWGKVKDKDNAVIVNAKIILIAKSGEKFETLTNAYGKYLLEVSDGIYDVQIIGTKGSVPSKYEDFEISRSRNHLDIELTTASNSKGSITELICKPNEYLADEFDCTLVTKNPSKENRK